MDYIDFDTLVEHLELRNAVPEVDVSDFKLTVPEINRPALQLTGFYAHFSNNRVQVIGNVEYTYLSTFKPINLIKSPNKPAFQGIDLFTVFCRGLEIQRMNFRMHCSYITCMCFSVEVCIRHIITMTEATNFIYSSFAFSAHRLD